MITQLLTKRRKNTSVIRDNNEFLKREHRQEKKKTEEDVTCCSELYRVDTQKKQLFDSFSSHNCLIINYL